MNEVFRDTEKNKTILELEENNFITKVLGEMKHQFNRDVAQDISQNSNIKEDETNGFVRDISADVPSTHNKNKQGIFYISKIVKKIFL